MSFSKVQKFPHLIIKARAGTGKTTTLVEALKVLRGEESAFTPSEQQKAIWDSVALSKGATSVCFVAFNKSIAKELQTRVPEGVQAMTMHSMGMKGCMQAYGRLKVNAYRTQNLWEKLTGKDVREVRKEYPVEIRATEQLVSLCKMNLLEGTREDLEWITSHYEIDTNGSQDKIFGYVTGILELAKDPTTDGEMDFDDMVWLPVVNKLPIPRQDLLLVDEAQDLNRCQQALARKVGRRLIFCGDDRQAIYGFAGADSDSLPRLFRELQDTEQGCEELPLTVTRRCAKSVVEVAKKYVPDFEAFETNAEGTVSDANIRPDMPSDYRKQVQDGDMVLSRVNAPLVSECFKFIKEGRKANIQGRDIGQGICNLIRRMKADDIPQLIVKLEKWYTFEVEKENKKKFPSETKLMSLEDRYDCIMTFVEASNTISGLVDHVQKIFTDESTGGILFSSVHKAKGLEADRVFILCHKEAPIPHPMAKTEWQVAQEYNLLYVAITRAIKDLVFVRGEM